MFEPTFKEPRDNEVKCTNITSPKNPKVRCCYVTLYLDFGDCICRGNAFAFYLNHEVQKVKNALISPQNDFFQFFLLISFYIATEAIHTKFGDPKSIMAEFHFSTPKKCKNAPKNDFSQFFLLTSFYIATVVIHTKFGDPKSILAEFHFSRPKKP